jgi:hypothetical protein
MTTLDDAVALASEESGLAVVSTLRADGTIQASLVNAGKMPHPATGAQTLAFVTYGKVKLANLRARPQLAVTFRKGWMWATVEGTTRSPGSPTPSSSGCFCARCSPPRAEPTTTGTNTTG